MILVVGGTGFVGRHLAQHLVAQVEQVRVLARRPRSAIPPQAEFVPGDVTKPESLAPAMAGVSVIYHLATIPKEKGGETFAAVNVDGVRNTIAAAQSAGIKRFIYMSVIGAMPDPRFPYLYSKWQAEEEVKKSGLEWSILKASIIFGPGDEFVRKSALTVKNVLEASFLPLDAPPSIWTRLLAWGKFIPLVPIPGSGQAKFQPIWVEDVAHCLYLLKNEKFVSQSVSVGGPEHVTYNQLVDLSQEALGLRRVKLPIPPFILGPLAGAMLALGLNFPVTKEQVALLAKDDTTDLDAVQRNFGFTPVALQEKIGYLREGI
ncbi:MAG: NAD(P)H-binding protein [Chloroflexi bacterium]|nr:NAD(P)H-binding protein [Chloroflexota bacterium]